MRLRGQIFSGSEEEEEAEFLACFEVNVGPMWLSQVFCMYFVKYNNTKHIVCNIVGAQR